MNKFENFIYLSICEISSPMFSSTHYSNYVYYCRAMNNSLKSGNLSYREKVDLLKISDYLKIIYGMDDSESWKHIIEYFESDRFFEFYTVVNLTNDLFPITGDCSGWFKK